MEDGRSAHHSTGLSPGRAGRLSSIEASKPPNLRHFRVLHIFFTAGL